MALDPEGVTDVPAGVPPNPPDPGHQRHWHSKLLSVCFAIFCFELGVFLLVFPWMDSWSLNYLSTVSPKLESVWLDPFFRGALSGLGLVNIYIAFLEVFRLLRLSRPPGQPSSAS